MIAKRIISIFIFALFILGCKPTVKETDQLVKTTKNEYDSVLAQKYNADQYGMRPYVMAFLKRGPNRSKDSLEEARLQKMHLENIVRLAEEGKLVFAGPFMDDGDIRGIYLFDVKTIEEAQKLTESDPLIQSGGLVMELHKWYGSAALMAIPDLHKKLEKVSVVE